VTLAAANLLPHRHLWVVFQPLTFSRTRVLFDEYVAALKDCRQIIFSEIYSDRETDPGDISSRMVADRINQLGGHAWFGEDFSQIRAWLDERAGPEDIILVMGPENIRDFADELTGRTSHLDD
jgi:UDP-N-acetylmuramate--alanine ligase